MGNNKYLDFLERFAKDNVQEYKAITKKNRIQEMIVFEDNEEIIEVREFYGFKEKLGEIVIWTNFQLYRIVSPYKKFIKMALEDDQPFKKYILIASYKPSLNPKIIDETSTDKSLIMDLSVETKPTTNNKSLNPVSFSLKTLRVILLILLFFAVFLPVYNNVLLNQSYSVNDMEYGWIITTIMELLCFVGVFSVIISSKIETVLNVFTSIFVFLLSIYFVDYFFNELFTEDGVTLVSMGYGIFVYEILALLLILSYIFPKKYDTFFSHFTS